MIDLDALKLPEKDTFPLTSGATYALNRSKQLKCRLIGNGAIVRYFGKPDTQALQTVRDCDTAGAENVIFELPPGTAAIGGSGGFHGQTLNIHGGGGLFHIRGNSHKNQFIRCIIADTVKESYAGYAGAEITDDPGKGIYAIAHPVAAVELISCEIQKGVTGRFHGLRFHGCDKIVIHGGKFTFDPDPKHYTASLRIHDNGDAEVIGADFFGGNFGLCPMGDGDGGINKPPGPERNYYDAMRLRKLTIRDTTFDGRGLGTFKLNPGLLAGEITNTKILNMYGSSVVATPFPYMNRPACKLTMNKIEGTLTNGGAKPKFFSDDNGAKDIRVTDSKLGGKGYTH